MNPTDLPAQVRAATQAAEQLGFPYSCIPEVGRLLRVLAAGVHSVGESGTGCGVGAAWIRSGLAPGARLVTVEHNPGRAASAAALFDGDPQVEVVCDGWRRLADFGPFSLLFCDNGGKDPSEGQHIVDMLAPGGVLVLDDFTPSQTWPPTSDGRRDHVREFWLTHPELTATEVLTTPTTAAVIATKRPPADHADATGTANA